MNRKKSRCVFGCDDFGAYMHRFPHPDRRSELHSAWVSTVGTKLKEVDPLKVYGTKRVCDYHFKTEQKTSGHRLTCSAVPTLHLEGMFRCLGASIDIEHNYCVPRMRDSEKPVANYTSLVTQYPLKETFERVPSPMDSTDQASTLQAEFGTKPPIAYAKPLRTTHKNRTLKRQLLKSKVKERNFKARLLAAEKVTNELALNSFPRKPKRCFEWTAIIANARNDLNYKPFKGSVVCSDHFPPSDIYTTTKGFSRLSRNAKPILNVKPCPQRIQLKDTLKGDSSDSSDDDPPETNKQSSGTDSICSESDNEPTRTKEKTKSKKSFKKQKSNAPPSNAPPSKRSRIAYEDLLFDDIDEFYEFGKFVAEQMMSLDIEDARIAQKEIKKVLKQLKTKKLFQCLEEPSTSQVAEVDPLESSVTIEEQLTIKVEPDFDELDDSTVQPNVNANISVPLENQPVTINAKKLSLVPTLNVKIEPSKAPAPYVLMPTSTPKIQLTKQQDDTAEKLTPSGSKMSKYAKRSKAEAATRFISTKRAANTEIGIEPSEPDFNLTEVNIDYNPSDRHSRSAVIKLEHVSDDDDT